MTTRLTCLCRTATIFAADGSLDERAQGDFLARLVDQGIGLYLGSGGSGEGHTLSPDEFRRLYAVGLEVGRGKVQVNANPPEQYTVAAVIEQARIAIACGIDVINLYVPAGWHAYKATDAEILHHYDQVLKAVKHPVALGPGPVVGYSPKASVVAELCRRHPQIVAVNLAGLTDTYFVQLRHMLPRPIDIYVPFVGSLNTLTMGATGLLGTESNIIPKTFRRYMDLYLAGEFQALGAIYADLQRFTDFTRKWHSGSPRWLKMALSALNLPGAAGGLRPPYLMPEPHEVESFAQGLHALGLEELTG